MKAKIEREAVELAKRYALKSLLELSLENPDNTTYFPNDRIRRGIPRDDKLYGSVNNKELQSMLEKYVKQGLVSKVYVMGNNEKWAISAYRLNPDQVGVVSRMVQKTP